MYYHCAGGLTGVESFLLKFSQRPHKKQVKATTNIFCAFISFSLLLFANVVPISALLSVWPSYRLAHSRGRRPVLISGSTLRVLGSLLTAWFPHIIIEFIGLVVTGCGVGFLYQVGVPMYTFIYAYYKYVYLIYELN